jgi:iron complex outermembrane recepter protein
MLSTTLPTAVVIVLIVRGSLLVAQQTESTAEPVVVAAPELGATNSSSVDPDVLGLDGDFRNVGTVMPNVSVDNAGDDSFQDVYAVRGLNNTPNFSKQALTIYIDDVPSASTFTNFTELGAIQSIELVRGPQGDLVGKNAEAGLLDIHTIVPDATLRIIGSAARASYDYWNGNALVSGPIIPNTFFAKIEGGYLSRDGYLDNTFRDTHPDFQQHAFGRIQFRLTPGSDWEIDFSAEYHYIRDGVQRFVPLDLPDPFRVAFNFDGQTDIDGNIESLRIVRTFDSVRLMLITSWREWSLEPYTADFDYSSAPIVVGRFDLDQTQLAQEIRLESPDPQGGWRWRVGAFIDRVTNSGSEIFAFPDFEKVISFDEHEDEFALFGQATRHFANGFEVTFGMRLDYDTEHIDRRRSVSFSLTTEFGSDQSEWNVQPKLVIGYEVAPDRRVYVSSAYGYRNGGFSFLETDPRLASFDAERVWANEIGARVDCVDHRLQFAGAVFVNRIEDYQVERLSIPPEITVFNAPLVVSYGGEIEITTKPFPGLDVKGTFGYTHSEFADFHDPLSGTDLSGKRTPFSPEFTAALLTRYSVRGLFVECELLVSGQTFYDEANTQSVRQAPHAQFNGRLGYENRNVRMYLYGENLNDALYFTQKIAYAGIGTPAQPRTIGFAVTFKL